MSFRLLKKKISHFSYLSILHQFIIMGLREAMQFWNTKRKSRVSHLGNNHLSCCEIFTGFCWSGLLWTDHTHGACSSRSLNSSRIRHTNSGTMNLCTVRLRFRSKLHKILFLLLILILSMAFSHIYAWNCTCNIFVYRVCSFKNVVGLLHWGYQCSLFP